MVISVSNLCVSYKDTCAVNNVSFNIKSGEIFGMIGVNGAGKTTIIESIEGLRTNYSGSIDVLGINPKHNRQKLYQQIGVQLQETKYQDKIKVCELGKLFGSMYDKRVDFEDLLRNFDLYDKRHSYISKLSGGQRQKLSIIFALMSSPKILFLDEITTGLDPKSRVDIWKKIKQLNKQGITICMTTHFMEEAEYLCDRIAIIHKGKIIALDSIPNLIQSSGIPIKICFSCDTILDTSYFSMWKEVVNNNNENNRYTIECISESIMEKLYALANVINAHIYNVSLQYPSLEDVFFKFTGETVPVDSVSSVS